MGRSSSRFLLRFRESRDFSVQHNTVGELVRTSPRLSFKSLVGKSISSLRTRRRHTNYFDHIRLIAAFMVLTTHQYAVTKESSVLPRVGIVGAWGVNIFFAISGYLNSNSLFASRSPPAFLLSRAFRIYPGLIACIVFMVLLGAAVTDAPPEKWSDLKYVF